MQQISKALDTNQEQGSLTVWNIFMEREFPSVGRKNISSSDSRICFGLLMINIFIKTLH